MARSKSIRILVEAQVVVGKFLVEVVVGKLLVEILDRILGKIPGLSKEFGFRRIGCKWEKVSKKI